MVNWRLVTIVALGQLLIAEAGALDTTRYIAKPLASVGFLGAAFTAPRANTALGRIIIASLLLAFVGDVLLLFDERETPLAFIGGIGAFLLGHVGYILAFRKSKLYTSLFYPLLGILLLPAIVTWRWLSSSTTPGVPPEMVVPVIAYIAVITLMEATALATAPASRYPYAQALGATLFFLSDLFVARQVFVAQEWINAGVGLPLYYAAQHVIAGLLY